MYVKAIRKIVDSNKGVFTFWLIMVFLSALCSKTTTGITTVKPGTTEIAHLGCKYHLTATADDNSCTGFFDKLEKDFDTDDVEFIFFENQSSRLFSFNGTTLRVPTADSFQQSYNSSLYDLYCNWKFHLS